MGYEEMRLTFKPSAIKILMIADAPPMPDTHFFYDQASSDSLRDFTIEAFANYVKDNVKTNSNIRGSAQYRKHLAYVLVKRALVSIGGNA